MLPIKDSENVRIMSSPDSRSAVADKYINYCRADCHLSFHHVVFIKCAMVFTF